MEHAFLYQHTKRTEWGYGAVTDTADDRTTFRFDDGTVRTITRGHIHMMVRVELDEPQATEVRKRIARPNKAAARKAPAAKKRVAKVEPAAVVIETAAAGD